MATSIDLNADLGERDNYTRADVLPNDAELVPLISSVNIACGAHAGNPELMREVVTLAHDCGVAVGAHPSYEDRAGFGRRSLRVTAAELESSVARQVGILADIAAREGVRLRHVKPHGALYNDAAREDALADVIVRAVRAVDPSLILVGLAGSRLLAAARRANLLAASEAFADRQYRDDGSLVPREQPGAVLDTVDAVVAQAVRLIRDRPFEVDTICVHGDTPGAVALARAVRAAIIALGVEIKAVGT